MVDRVSIVTHGDTRKWALASPVLLYCPTIGVSLTNNDYMYYQFVRVPRMWDSTMRGFRYELAHPFANALVMTYCRFWCELGPFNF